MHWFLDDKGTSWHTGSLLLNIAHDAPANEVEDPSKKKSLCLDAIPFAIALRGLHLWQAASVGFGFCSSVSGLLA